MTNTDDTPATPGNDEAEDAMERASRELSERGIRELEEAGERSRRGHATRAPRTKGRTTPVAVRFDEFTLQRLKDLAALRKTGYQTLLKQFVQERLYEEEKRERIVE